MITGDVHARALTMSEFIEIQSTHDHKSDEVDFVVLPGDWILHLTMLQNTHITSIVSVKLGTAMRTLKSLTGVEMAILKWGGARCAILHLLVHNI